MSRLSERFFQIEGVGVKPICVSYVVDDGWDEEHPKEILEYVELAVKRSYAEEMRIVIAQHKAHKGAWLTEEIAGQYEAKSWAYRVLYDSQNIEEIRAFSVELQEKYGVTELEAMNILNGRNVKEYLNKYDRIRRMIPKQVNAQKICDDIFRSYGMTAI